MSQVVDIGGKRLGLTNLEKALYPSGFTKAQVIDYYARVAPLILPHLKGRPVSFKRYPNGTKGQSFFQKNKPDHAPAWVKSVTLKGEGSGRRGSVPKEAGVEYCLVGDVATLAWAANAAALELHVPLGKARAPNRPDAVVFDLDPGAPATLLDCCRVALRLRELLDQNGLECLAKTSGSKGLHVWVPLNTATTFEKTRPFARAVAEALTREDPGRVTATMAKRLRGGKVFVDWNQNARGQTTACVYSLRATEGPNVSTPVSWAEVERAVKAGDAGGLTLAAPQMLERMKGTGDLFSDALSLKQRLPKQLDTSGPPELLKPYRAKRNFAATPEPTGSRASAKRGKRKNPFFCVQKHLASHLHYDFRLEHNGVLLSWAVPRGPSLRPEDKRLAMKVEDHPLDYGDFEGVIPEGYGAGIVMLWDTGTWHAEVRDVDAAVAKGDLKFRLDGVKLKGSWALVRTHGRSGEDGRSWLLIKHRDEWAGDVDVVGVAPLSVKSFGDLADILAADDPAVWASHRPAEGGKTGAMLAEVIAEAARRKAKPRGKRAPAVSTRPKRGAAVSGRRTRS